MPTTKLNRRAVMALGVAAMTLPQSLFALTTEQASDLVARLVADINKIISANSSDARMVRDFEAVLSKYGDMPIIAQTILGVPWRSASSAQRREFTKALQGYLARKYGPKFREFIGGTIEVQSARPVRSFYEVKSVARLRGQAPLELTFLVSDGSGKNLFFNMIIEGINLRTTENTEINALLDSNRGDLNAMIADLRTRG